MFKKLQKADRCITSQNFRLNELLLPLAITDELAVNKEQKGLFDLATLLHEYQKNHKENQHE